MSDNESTAPGGLIPTGKDAVATRDAARTARADLTRQTQAMEAQRAAQRAELERKRAELEADFRRQRAELEAQMGPLREQLAQMTEVLWTVDLYLGRHESIETLRGGEPAPEGTPLTIRQRVLVMAEESLVLMGERPDGMDAEGIPAFVRWLVEDDTHLDRVLPEPKGVVVLVPTRVRSQTGNVFEDAARDSANQRAYWLIRNGQRLHLLTTDPDLRVIDRVLPNRTEFSEVFERRLFGFLRTGGPVQPGSDEWMEMEQRADKRRRHYMRLMLVLQGLIDRTPVWHPLPQGGINLLDVTAQDDGQVVLVQDGDTSMLLDDGRPGFREWQQALNARLRPGVRIVGSWQSPGFLDLREESLGWAGGHTRIHPRNAPYPSSDEAHLVEDRRDGGVVIRYARTDEVWRTVDTPIPDRPGWVHRSHEPVTPTQRASCLVRPDDDWVLALDLASVDDLRYYLDSRTDRSQHYLSMAPTLRTALAIKEAEAAEEAPFRRLLGDMLAGEGAEDADTLVEGLIHEWKVAHTWHRPLNGDPEHERKAAQQIIDTYRQSVAAEDETGAMVALGRSLPGTVAVARRRQGTWVAVRRAEHAHDPGVFVHLTTLRRDGTPGKTTEWVTLSPRQVAALTIVWEDPAWATWTLPSTPWHYLSEPQRTSLVDEVVAAGNGQTVCVTETWDPYEPGTRTFTRFDWIDAASPADVDKDTPHGADHPDGLDSRLAETRYVVRPQRGSDPALPAPHRQNRACFGKFSPGRGAGDDAPKPSSLPWWPDSAKRYGDARPRLVWLNDDLLAEIADYLDRCAENSAQERAAQKAQERTVYRWVEPTLRAIAEEVEAVAWVEFVADYGADAHDLWPSQREQVNTKPVHPRTLWGLFTIALDHGHPITGQTLDALNEHARAHGNRARGEWHPERGLQDLHGFGGVRVPDPDPEDAPIPSAPHTVR